MALDAAAILEEANATSERSCRLWSVKDVMSYAAISRTTVWRLMKRGKISGFYIGKSLRFKPEVVMRELENIGLSLDGSGAC